MRVDAREKWNDSGVDVLPGQRLSITSEGEWIDSSIPCGPEGFSRWYLKPFEAARRMPRANWFELVAAIGRGGERHRIGRSASFVAGTAGRLYLFANDLPVMYWNNKGSVEATIRVEGAVVGPEGFEPPT